MFANFAIKNTFSFSPVITLGSVAAAGLSYASARFTSINISNPMDAAKFTTVAALALIINKEIMQSDNNIVSKIPFAILTAYGVHLIANPEKTIASFAKLSALAAASLFLGLITYVSSPLLCQRSDGSFSIDKVADDMAREAYQNSWKTVAAAGSAWLAARSFSKLGLDPQTTMVFTAAASLIYYATKPLFTALENKNRNLPSRAASLFNLTKVSADMLKLGLPLGKEFAKTCAVAATFIAIFDFADVFFPKSSGKTVRI